jgi:hypothetical protein
MQNIVTVAERHHRPEGLTTVSRPFGARNITTKGRCLFWMCLWIKNVRAQGPHGDHEPLFPRALSGVHVSQTHSKKNKNEKILKKIFFFCLFECVFDLRTIIQGSRTSWDHEPLFPRALSGFLNHKHIQKNKNEKSFKKFFFFCLFECVCESRTSGLEDLMGIMNPCFLKHSQGVHVSQTHSKKQKRKKF